jgi:hypothetical protein
MTPLATELLRILDAESGRQPMSPDSLRRVLRALGWSPLPAEPEIVAALEALLAGGWIEAVHSARLGKRYRIMRVKPGVDMSEPGPEAA